MGEFQAGLTDQDDLSDYPSASSPLAALGIDPDEARANPELLKGFMAAANPDKNSSGGPPVRMPPDDDGKPDASTAKAASLGGAGATPASPAEPTDTDSYGQSGLSLLNRNLQGATKTADETSTTPPADIARLTTQRDKLSAPAPLFDPASGKRLATTKQFDAETGQTNDVKAAPSVGSRIWRGVRGGLEGLATGGIPGAIIGTIDPEKVTGTAYGAPDKQYERADQRRQQQLATTNSDLDTSFKTWKDQVDAQKAKASEYRANAALGKDQVQGATGLLNAENKPETETQKANAKFALDQKRFDLRRQQLSTDPSLAKLSPLNKAYYMAEGKVYQPRESTEADVLASNIAKGIATFQQSHGGKKPATMEEFNSVIAAAKGDLDKGKNNTAATKAQQVAVDNKKNDAIRRAMHDFAEELKPGSDGLISKDSLANYEQTLQEIQNSYEEDSAALAGGDAGPHQVVTVDPATGQAKWTPQAPAIAPPAAPAPAPAAPAAPQGKPQPAPDGTRRQAPDGTIEVKKNGKWEKDDNK